MGGLHSFATVRIGINQLIAGLMVYFLALYLGDFCYAFVTKTEYLHVAPIPSVKIAFLSSLPVLGPILFDQNVLVYVSFAAALVLGLILYRTTWGLKIRAVGVRRQIPSFHADGFGFTSYFFRGEPRTP